MMRRWQVGLLVAVMCLATQAWAGITIEPIATAFPGTTFTFAAAQVSPAVGCSTGDAPGTGTCSQMNGELMSAVYREDTTGNLLFMWQLHNTGAVSMSSAVTWRFFPSDAPGNILNWDGVETVTNGVYSQSSDSSLFDELKSTGAHYAGGNFAHDCTAGCIAPTQILWDPTLPGQLGVQVEADFGADLRHPTLLAGDYSTIWFVYTDAKGFRSTDPIQPVFSTAEAQGNTSGISLNFNTYEPAPVPEPGTLFLVGSGFIGLAGAIRRKLVG